MLPDSVVPAGVWPVVGRSYAPSVRGPGGPVGVAVGMGVGVGSNVSTQSSRRPFDDAMQSADAIASEVTSAPLTSTVISVNDASGVASARRRPTARRRPFRLILPVNV